MRITRHFLVGLLVVAIVLATGLGVFAQFKRPYRDGTVWDIAFIRMKPGMESAYLTYIATDWKKEQESFKKEGLIVSYKVIATEPHSPGDWNLMLMTEYKDLASMEANGPKMEAAAVQMFGDETKIRQGYKERLEIREVLGNRLSREIVLEPRAGTSE